MTADDFTTASHAEAEDYARTPRMNVGTVRDRIAGAHMAGAEWGRDHALAQEPTDAEVEAACAGFYEDPSGLTSWTGLVKAEPRLAEVYREGIRRALSAARATRRDEETR